MTSAVNGLPETHGQRSDFPWRKGAQARRTEKIVVGLCLTQFPQQNPYRRVRPIGDEKYPLADDFGTLPVRTFLVVYTPLPPPLAASLLHHTLLRLRRSPAAFLPPLPPPRRRAAGVWRRSTTPPLPAGTGEEGASSTPYARPSTEVLPDCSTGDDRLHQQRD